MYSENKVPSQIYRYIPIYFIYIGIISEYVYIPTHTHPKLRFLQNLIQKIRFRKKRFRKNKVQNLIHKIRFLDKSMCTSLPTLIRNYQLTLPNEEAAARTVAVMFA